MEIPGNPLLLAVAVLAALAILTIIVVASRKKARRTRVAAQHRQDESIILNIYNDIRSSDIRTYKDLPNRESRIEWLRSTYPEFMEVVECRYSENDIDGVVASNLDVRLLHDDVDDRNTSVRTLRNSAIAMSLNEYQQILDKRNTEHRKQKEVRARELAKRRAAEAAELKVQQNAAKTYWNSLSSEQQANFKRARGATARRNALPAMSSDYSVDAMYPLIMAMNFSNINTNSNQSIDYCASSASSHSSGGYFDSDSSWSGGSSYSDGGSSSCDGGGGGGGE